MHEKNQLFVHHGLGINPLSITSLQERHDLRRVRNCTNIACLPIKNGFSNKLAELLLGCLQEGLYFWGGWAEKQRVIIAVNGALPTIYSNKKI